MEVKSKTFKRFALVSLVSLLFVLLSPLSSNATTPLATPGTPTASCFPGSSTSIRVSFSDVPNATSYTVKVYASNGSTLIRQKTNYIKDSEIPDLSSNTQYRVRVIANGTGAYTDSAQSQLSPLFSTLPPLDRPSAPSGAAVNNTVNSVSLTFNSIANASSYTLRPYLSSNPISVVGSPRTSFVSGGTLSGLSANTVYKFTVQAVSTSNSFCSSLESEFSSDISTNPEAQIPNVSPGPPNVSVTPGSSAIFSVNFISPDGGTLTYQWQRDVNDGLGFLDIAGANSNSYEISSTSLDQNGYLYRVKVRNTLNGTFKEDNSESGLLTVALPSNDANLSWLNILPGNLSPIFNPATTNYTLSISDSVSSININSETSSNVATVLINNGSSTLVNVDPVSIPQVIIVKVTAQDGSTKLYNITVKRVVMTKSSTSIRPNTTPRPTPSPSPSSGRSTLQSLRFISMSPTSTPIGTTATVTISGSGFSNLIKVSISNMNATIISSSDTQIVLQTPTGATSGPFVISTRRGTTSTPRFIIGP